MTKQIKHIRKSKRGKLFVAGRRDKVKLVWSDREKQKAIKAHAQRMADFGITKERIAGELDFQYNSPKSFGSKRFTKRPFQYFLDIADAAIKKKKMKEKTYDVQDVVNAEYNLEPLKCRWCGSKEVTYDQGVGDAYCASCGDWQSNPEEPKNRRKLAGMRGGKMKTEIEIIPHKDGKYEVVVEQGGIETGYMFDSKSAAEGFAWRKGKR
jgi:ribosomal protein S27E